MPALLPRPALPHLLLLLIAAALAAAAADPAGVSGGGAGSPESRALLDFMHQFDGNGRGGAAFRTWDASADPCSWEGVLCKKDAVWGLKVENAGLEGPVTLKPLAGLPHLRTLSLMNNSLTGSLPNVSLVPAMKSVYLSHNRLAGDIPGSSFSDSRILKKLHLADNGFSGEIPRSLGRLPGLKELGLERNRFEGAIPDLHRLRSLNLSFNLLSGKIPASLSRMNSSAFKGNPDLCGSPLPNPCPAAPAPTTRSRTESRSTTLVVIVAVVVAALALTAICALTFVVLRSHRRSRPPSPPPQPVAEAPSSGGGLKRSPQGRGRGDVGGGRLCFVREEGGGRFELPDLLRASAEVLGSGSMGSSYRAALQTGPVVVVKRFRQMNGVGREEFQEHMRRMGRLSHPNLLPLVAYYYRREEKLLVTDFVPGGSLAARLHGNTSAGGAGNPGSLDWPARLKIVKGVARGLSYLYRELPTLVAPHGHLKSSNVLLSSAGHPLLADYALAPVADPDHARRSLVAHRSPESRRLGRLSRKSDVWALGLLILETLTGTLPPRSANPSPPAVPADDEGDEPGEDSDLAGWVESVGAALGRPADVLDKSMPRACPGEIGKLLRIGVGCCEDEVGRRPEMREAVEWIEAVRESDDDEEFFSSTGGADGDGRPSGRLSVDFAL